MTDSEVLDAESKGIKIYPRPDDDDAKLAAEMRATRIKLDKLLTATPK